MRTNEYHKSIRVRFSWATNSTLLELYSPQVLSPESSNRLLKRSYQKYGRLEILQVRQIMIQLLQDSGEILTRVEINPP